MPVSFYKFQSPGHGVLPASREPLPAAGWARGSLPLAVLLIRPPVFTPGSGLR